MKYLNLNDGADGYTITGTALDVKDLACPTWGVGRRTAADGAVITTVGPPYLLSRRRVSGSMRLYMHCKKGIAGRVR